MKKILTPADFIIRTVNAHPALYASASYNESRFRVFDHVFNVIGNSSVMSDFIGESLTADENNQCQKWFNCERAAYGYTKTIKIERNGKILEIANIEEGGTLVVPITEKENHPEIVYWVEFDCDYSKDPYPNFDKQYSTVWQHDSIEFDIFGKDWFESAIWYYNKCREYFVDSSKSYNFAYAFPTGNTNKDKNTIKSYHDNLTFEKYPTNEDISNAYECEFIGDRNNEADLINFITRRWIQRQTEILSFIDETLCMLNEKLKQR